MDDIDSDTVIINTWFLALQVTVYIRVVFLKIGEIDTLKENFMADAFIQARWREPALDGQASQVCISSRKCLTSVFYLTSLHVATSETVAHFLNKYFSRKSMHGLKIRRCCTNIS